MNSFFASQFNYCLWSGRVNKITRLHEGCLRITYSDSGSSFEDLQIKMEVSQYMSKLSSSSRQKCLKYQKTSVLIVKEIFEKRNNAYNLRKPSEFFRLRVNSVFHGQESISHLGPHIWDTVTVEMKNLTTISAFKREVKKWKLVNSSYRLCKSYNHEVGFT